MRKTLSQFIFLVSLGVLFSGTNTLANEGVAKAVSAIENEDINGFSDDLDGFDNESNTDEIDLDGFSDEISDFDGFTEEEVGSLGLNKKSHEDEVEGWLKDTSISGVLAFSTAAGYKSHESDGIEYSGINQAQTSLYLQLDSKLSDDWKMRISGDFYYDAVYDLYSHNDYNDNIIDEYRTQHRFDDTYIEGSITDNLDLKAGRQVVVWGKSDNIRVTDVINPIDNRLLGVTDIEYLRLPVGMAKFDYYTGDWDISMMIIPEARVSLNAPLGSEYLPSDSNGISPEQNFLDDLIDRFGITNPSGDTPQLQDPATSWSNTQYAFAANGVFSGWDLSFYAARVYDKDSHTEEVLEEGGVASDFVYDHINMLGTAFNIVQGSWLFKSEFAYLNDLQYSTTTNHKNRLDVLVGVEYFGFSDTSMSFELVNRHIFSYEEVMRQAPDSKREDSAQSIMRVTRNFMHEELEVTGLLNLLGPLARDGGFGRFWLEYEVMEAVQASAGVVIYWSRSNSYFEDIKDNDRVFADISYSF